MDLKRKDYKNKIQAEIFTLEKAIELDTNMLEGLKNQGNTSFVNSQISKVTSKNNNRKNSIEELRLKIQNIDKGELDQEISSLMENTTQQHINGQQMVAQKRAELKEQKKADSLISQNYYQSMVRTDRKERYNKKDMDRSYSYFLRGSDTIPDYIKRNLKEMPNNKGYIWRGIWCFGELSEENTNLVTLFERQKGGLLIIHETSPTEYKIFHKKGKDRKFLYKLEQRKNLN